MPKATIHPPAELAQATPDQLAAAIKEAARSLGADVVGLANPELLATEAPNLRPQAIFPEVQTIIVIGRRVTRGALRGIEEGTNFQSYDMFGRSWLEDQYLSRTAFEVVGFLEDLGYEAVPLFNYPADMQAMGVALREGQPPPNVVPDIRLAAAAAGLGAIGRHGEFITPEFGPLQRMSMILTDAPTRHDAPRQFDFCDGCAACAEACPLQAAAGAPRECQRGGATWQEYPWADQRCAKCKNGARPSRFVGSTQIDRIAAGCGRACLASLEARGKLLRRFHQPFRTRPAWSVNAFGEVDSGGR